MAAKSAKRHESPSEDVTVLKKRNTNMVQLPRPERNQQSPIGRSWRNSLRSDFRVELHYLLRRHLWIFLVTTLASLSLAVLYLLTTPTLFTAHVQLLLDPRIPMPLPSARNEDRIIKEFDNPEVESQLGILQSAHIRQSVVNKLKLHENPEFTLETSHPLRNLFDSLWGTVPVGENESANNAKPQPQPQPQDASPDPAALRAASDYLRDGLGIERVKLSYILDVSFTSHDPETAALVANSVADTYIGEQLTTSSQIASQGAKWLEERIDQLRRKVNEASFKLQEFRARRSDVVSEQTTIDELESTTSAYRKLYESYLQAYIDSAQRQALPGGIARIVTYASPPVTPSHPRKFKTLAAALIFGLLAGYGIAATRNLFDNTVRGRRQIEKAGITYLGELRGLNRDQRLQMVANEPLSQFSYDLRRLERNLSVGRTKPIQSLGVTPVSAEFSTSEVSYNLAYSYATAGKRVILIDGNLLSPILTQTLASGAKKGLADLLPERAEAQACVVINAFSGVDFLPAGAMEGPLFATWPFASTRLGDRLKKTLDNYDMVIFDLPPAFSPAALSIAQLVETVIIVAQSGHTQMPLVTEIATALDPGTAKFVGVAVAMNSG